MKNLTYYIHCRKPGECVVMAQHDDGTDEASPYMSYLECNAYIEKIQTKKSSFILDILNSDLFKNNVGEAEKQKQAIMKSLTWVVYNLGETEKNTFPHAIKAYCQAAIDFMEKAIVLEAKYE